MTTGADTGYIIAFPTLFISVDWIEHHVVWMDDFGARVAFRFSDWQAWDTLNHYRVKPEAKPTQKAAAFFNRRSLIVRPQKTGKGPWTASMTAFEALGPARFNGFAEGSERYRCDEHGCSCGWVYSYMPGEAMGRPWPKAVIQLTAVSVDQVDNVYKPLQDMIRYSVLSEQAKVLEGFIRLPNEGIIAPVTSAANSRLGNPITFAVQDEVGLWVDSNKMRNVADTQLRGLAGMGGRAIQTTNAWDPAADSVGQRSYLALADGIYRDFPQAPAHLSYTNKAERHRIHKAVYAGSPWVDLDDIEGLAVEMMEHDPGQAERFFGNRTVSGHSTFLESGQWGEPVARAIKPGEKVCAGFDGSENNDWTALRLETLDGFRFTPTYGPDNRPTIWNPEEWGGKIPRGEVNQAIAEVMDRYKVYRAYFDPKFWNTEIEEWALEYGDDLVMEWPTYRTVPMHDALVRYVTDLTTGKSTHDDCKITDQHVANARKIAKPNERFILGKASETQKMDACMADVLCHEAACDARADGWGVEVPEQYVYSI